MIEEKLIRALEADGKGSKALSCRLSRARVAESVLGQSLDYIVSDDMRMYNSLKELKKDSRDGGSQRLQNALRWYYRTVNNDREFPRMRDFESIHNL